MGHLYDTLPVIQCYSDHLALSTPEIVFVAIVTHPITSFFLLYKKSVQIERQNKGAGREPVC